QSLLFRRPFVRLFAFSPSYPLPTTPLYPLSLHAALPISPPVTPADSRRARCPDSLPAPVHTPPACPGPPRCPDSGRERNDRVHRSEEHTSELQSRENLVCRLLLEKKK